jgi:regulator of protease activity HflC (stomatin/prohibitin superfamily)
MEYIVVMKMLYRLGSAILVLLVVFTLIWLMGSRNPVTPAGYVGYLTQGALLGKTRFYGLQKGPTSPGRTWLLDVVNVSVTPYTFAEDFSGANAVLSKDNLKIAFRVHVVWRVRATRVQDFVERFSTLYGPDHSDRIVDVAYSNYVREPLRTYARDEIQKVNGLTVKDEITPIGQRVLARVLQLTQDSPFEITSIVVGNVQYPEAVADAVAQKLATTQVLERKQIEIEVAEAEAKKRIVEAGGIAESMRIINESLTSPYLQHEAIEAQKAMVNSPNHTTIYIPVGAMGVPLVETLQHASK